MTWPLGILEYSRCTRSIIQRNTIQYKFIQDVEKK